MEFRLAFKTPDIIDYAVEGIEDPEERERQKTALEKFIKYGENVCIEFDTEKGTATVLPVHGDKPGPFTCTIRWGEAMTRAEVYEKGDLGEEYSFDTIEEYNAFMLGLQAHDGWLDCVITSVNGEIEDADDDIYGDTEDEDEDEGFCDRCGTALVNGYCGDETCPFSDHEQSCDVGWIGHPDYSKLDEDTQCGCNRRQRSSW